MRSNDSRARDELILTALHLIEVEGWTNEKAGSHIGMTKNAIIGVRNRINNECNAVQDFCREPENKNGGMPPMWWAE